MEEFECLIYTEFSGERSELINKLASILRVSPNNLGVASNILAADVLTNDDNYFEEGVDKLEDKYLTYSYILDIGSCNADVSIEDMIKELSTILECLWNDGYPAVAECEYKEQLPHNGEGMLHQLKARG